ncbi:MAG TPA: adenylyltransferase/cytidyltransferase family protein, partial [Bdellovibrionales bacterium]|nr:adenylyltransferase/cytidyltransferase family protein [Bdellovibrionales bacterium]
MSPARIVYVPIVADLFHYGHLQVLEFAAKKGDHVVCGLLTDEGVLTYRKPTITNYRERHAVLAALKCVHEILPQHSKDSTDNLRLLHEKYPAA